MMSFRFVAFFRAVCTVLAILFGSMMMTFVPASYAQQAGESGGSSLPVSNAERIMEEVEELLSDSPLIAGIAGPVALKALMPQRYELRLIEHLHGEGLRLRSNDAPPVLELRLFTENRLEQRSAEGEITALRLLKGELHLFLSNESSEITATEVLPFSYRDTIRDDSFEDIRARTQAGADWPAVQFSEVIALPPKPGPWKRYGQPAILTAATGITVFLLFNVRS